ncbi:MAG: desulfoferrodoxin family protein [Bacilli bacterium]
MKKDLKIYICKHCGNIIVKLEDSKVPVVCCGEKMDLITPNTVDAAIEKHIPIVDIIGNTVTVKIGEIEHPMTEEHHISWVILNTINGIQIKYLTNESSCTFETTDEILEVYEYCNLHGLWKTNI